VPRTIGNENLNLGSGVIRPLWVIVGHSDSGPAAIAYGGDEIAEEPY